VKFVLPLWASAAPSAPRIFQVSKSNLIHAPCPEPTRFPEQESPPCSDYSNKKHPRKPKKAPPPMGAVEGPLTADGFSSAQSQKSSFAFLTDPLPKTPGRPAGPRLLAHETRNPSQKPPATNLGGRGGPVTPGTSHQAGAESLPPTAGNRLPMFLPWSYDNRCGFFPARLARGFRSSRCFKPQSANPNCAAPRKNRILPAGRTAQARGAPAPIPQRRPNCRRPS